jgi:predicted phosphodiesterase
MRLAWLTDLHLNFLDPEAADAFCASLAEVDADAFALRGDIGEAPDVALHLNALDRHVERPVYFVLGNHDFYRGSFAGVRERITALCAACPRLRWLTAAGVLPLTERACLIGHDSWADGRHGCLWEGRVTTADWLPPVCCKAVGDVLREAMAARPERRMTVLCGHTHQPADALVLPNLRVLTGGAEYGEPRVQRVLDIP